MARPCSENYGLQTKLRFLKNRNSKENSMKRRRTCKALLSHALVSAILLAAAAGPALAQARDGEGQGSVSPQEYFADRIRMEAGQPAVDTIPEL